MKKILLILLCLPLLFTTCKKEEEAPNNNGNNQDDIVGKKWSGYVPNFGDRIFELNNDGYLYFYTVNCIAYFQNDTLGEWLIIGDTIKYTYTNNNIEYKQIFGVMDGYSNTEIKFVLTSNSNSTCVIHTFTTSNCTYVPDDAFEQHLIDEGYDNVLDDYVTTASIDTVTYLYISEKHIYDLRGIEDFTALTYLDCYSNQLTTLDLSNNPALDTLACTSNQLTTLDVSNNTALTVLRCGGNQLTSLDVRNGNNTNITTFTCTNNPNLTCINVDDAVWSTANWTGIDPQHYFSEQCP